MALSLFFATFVVCTLIVFNILLIGACLGNLKIIVVVSPAPLFTVPRNGCASIKPIPPPTSQYCTTIKFVVAL